MDARLAIPVLILAGALLLAGGVERSLESSLAPFRVEGGQLATTLAIGGVGGVEPELRWADAPDEASHFVVVGRDLDAGEAREVFWVEEIGGGLRHFEAPGVDASLRHRLHVRVHALAEPLALPEGASPERAAREAAERAVASTTWFLGGGWLRRVPASSR